MQKSDETAIDAKTMMASASGIDLAGSEDQLKTTCLYESPAEFVAFFRSRDLAKITDLIMTFSFDRGLLVRTPRARTRSASSCRAARSSQDNVKLRFDPSYMEMAAEEKL